MNFSQRLYLSKEFYKWKEVKEKELKVTLPLTPELVIAYLDGLGIINGYIPMEGADYENN